MSPKLEGLVRGLLTVVAFAVLGYVANATNIVNVVGPAWATVIAGAAAAALAGLDHHSSPAGTVAFGMIGKAR